MSSGSQPEVGGQDAYPVLNEDGTSNPQSIGRYRIERKLGSGGMGTVYLAVDSKLRRRVALKVLPRERSQNPVAVKRFQAEAKAAANLKHDNIVAVYESGQSDGYTYIAMEYVDGIDVHDLVQRREVIPVKRSVSIVKQVASALQHAHERGIVHRDIKPSNLLIQRTGTVKVADLGLARSMDEASDAGITRDGTTVGTVDYMSPEQARSSRKADVRSDIYSLGCTWYHMLTGEPPYSEGGLTERLRLHATGQPPDPRDINPKVPAGIVAILGRMMAKNPDDRYATPKEFLEDLAQANLTKDKAEATVLAALDQASASPTGKENSRKETAVERGPETKRAGNLPSRDPILGVSKSQASVVVPYQLIGTVVAGVAAFALAIYGIVYWGPSWGGGGANAEQTEIGLAADNPFLDDVVEHSGPKGNRGSSPEKDDKKKNDEAQKPDDKVASDKGDDESNSMKKDEDRLLPLVAGDREEVQRHYLPRWVADATETEQTQGMATTIVGESDTGNSHFSLQQAIESLPQQGGVITLPGQGPYLLPALEVSQRDRIIIRAGGEDRPLIGLRQGSDASAILDVKGGTLELIGVDLVVMTAESAPSTSLTAVRVSDGNLIVRNCSLTLSADSGENVTGFHVERKEGSNDAEQSQVLMEQTAVIGQNLTALSIQADSIDVVLSNDLFVAGVAPAIRLQQRKSELADPQRLLRMIGCSVVSGRTALEIAAPTTKRAAIPTEITSVGSLFSTYERSDSAAFLTMTKKSKRKGSLDGLKWRSVGTAYQGWPRFIVERNSDKDEVLAVNHESWQAIWGEPEDKKQFDAATWPATDPLSNAGASLAPFSLDSLPNRQAESLFAGSPPGCRIDSLHLGDGTLVERLSRPQAPVRTGGTSNPFKDALRVSLDLNRRDLGALLRKPDLPNPVVIIATGSGLRKFTPATIENRSVRIEFQQKPGETELRLLPSVPRRAGQTTPEAMFSVKGGQLQLVNGNFSRTPGSSVARTPWFLDVVEGEFLLQNCHIIDPPGGDPAQGLIRWQRNESGDAKRLESHIRSSFLAGDGALVAADMRGQVLFTNNSVLASLSDLFVLDLRQATGNIDSSLVLEHSTFSAGSILFRVEATQMPTPPQSPLGIFAQSCVFGAPLLSANSDTNLSLMKLSGEAIRQRQVVWFGDSNGYADEIAVWLNADANADRGNQSFGTQWRDLWGHENVRNPLTESGGVLFAKPLPALHELTPENFSLHKNAAGSRWDVRGRPIGAKTSDLQIGKRRRQKGLQSAGDQKQRTTPRKKSNGF